MCGHPGKKLPQRLDGRVKPGQDEQAVAFKKAAARTD
jgi:hypothetical protein